MRRLVLASTLFLLLPAARRANATPIIGGSLDTGDPAVNAFQIQSMTGGFLCTCEVVSPHVVMTAAHCVDPESIGLPLPPSTTEFSVFFGDDVSMSGPVIAVSEAHFHPLFDLGNLGAGHDIAIAILMQDATTIPGITIVPLPPNRTPLTASLDGMPIEVVGYGQTCGSSTCSAGAKHYLSTSLGMFDDLFVTIGFSGHGTCEGDSGGPAIMTIGGARAIVAVTSFGASGCTASGTSTRVDAFTADFVDPWISIGDPGTVPDHCGADGVCQWRGCATADPDCATIGVDCGPNGICQSQGCAPLDTDCGAVVNVNAAAIGSSCGGPSDCTTGVCEQGMCTQQCDPNQGPATCSSFSCQTTADGSFCLLAPSGGGCSVTALGSPSRGVGLVALIVLALGVAFAERRRRRSAVKQ